MHGIGYILRKGERSEALSVKYLPGSEANINIRPLGVAVWPQGDGTCGPFLRSVVMGLLYLRVLAKL